MSIKTYSFRKRTDWVVGVVWCQNLAGYDTSPQSSYSDTINKYLTRQNEITLDVTHNVTGSLSLVFLLANIQEDEKSKL